MLTNNEKLQPEERPLADLAIKTLKKCRKVSAPIISRLPVNIQLLSQGYERKQDALIAELYNGKITFGEYNTAGERLRGEYLKGISEYIASSQSHAPKTAQTPKENAQSPPLPKASAGVEQSQLATRTFQGTRLALIIGNGDYAKLPKLTNPPNDARSIADVLQKMGYQTQLLLDASDQSIRTKVRQFASELSKADVALVYYAGHGAQLNGSNYILPIDIEIPRTEADIQFSGLKVDDLINNLASGTKIVFLDACRDNPALFKNLVSGRGSSSTGLAPATASNFNHWKPGGGIFIAYATDAGAVADDGHGQHSPFTQALLRYIQKPVSIDDMFSLVTREVRLVTKNTQRPYKYASLENIICLTPACSNAPPAETGDIVQQTRQVEEEELQIALQTNTVSAIETYLQKYPDTTKQKEIQSRIGALRRSEFTEWTLYTVSNQNIPQYMQLSSIERTGNRAAVKVKFLTASSVPTIVGGKAFPDAAYVVDLSVYDCAKAVTATAEEDIFNRSGRLLSHYKIAEAKYLNLSIGQKLPSGSVGLITQSIVCREEASTPLISKKQLTDKNFTSLMSMPFGGGGGEIFWAPAIPAQNVQDQREAIMVMSFNTDHNLKEDYLPNVISIADLPNFRTAVVHVLLKCKEQKAAWDRVEYWNARNELVAINPPNDRSTPIAFSDLVPSSPNDTLHRIVCNNDKQVIPSSQEVPSK